MELWSLLSYVINYVQYNRNYIDYFKLDVKALQPRNLKRIYNSLEEDQRHVIDIAFGDTPEKNKEYFDAYEGDRSEMLYTTKCDENSNLGTTYLGRGNISRSDKIRAKEKIPEHGYSIAKLLDGTVCQIHVDTGASKSFMSKTHYLRCKSFHLLPRFAFKLKIFRWGMYSIMVYYL